MTEKIKKGDTIRLLFNQQLPRPAVNISNYKNVKVIGINSRTINYQYECYNGPAKGKTPLKNVYKLQKIDNTLKYEHKKYVDNKKDAMNCMIQSYDGIHKFYDKSSRCNNSLVLGWSNKIRDQFELGYPLKQTNEQYLKKITPLISKSKTYLGMRCTALNLSVDQKKFILKFINRTINAYPSMFPFGTIRGGRWTKPAFLPVPHVYLSQFFVFAFLKLMRQATELFVYPKHPPEKLDKLMSGMDDEEFKKVFINEGMGHNPGDEYRSTFYFAGLTISKYIPYFSKVFDPKMPAVRWTHGIYGLLGYIYGNPKLFKK